MVGHVHAVIRQPGALSRGTGLARAWREMRRKSYVREEPVSEDVDLVREWVEVVRRPVDRPVAAGEDAFRERTIEAEQRREEAVVTKEARVVEEIGLRRTQETERETVSDTVRRTEVVVEEDEGDKLDRR
jgi:stress response protein YsnF